MTAVKKMLGLYVFGPPLTNPKDPLLLKQFKLTPEQALSVDKSAPNRMKEKDRLPPPEAYKQAKHKNLRRYYSYLSDYYKTIDLKFDSLRYYESEKKAYSEEDRHTYDFYLYLFEQMREHYKGSIKCDSSGYASEALRHANKTTTFKEVPRYVANNSEANRLIASFFSDENLLKRVLLHKFFISKSKA
jgi:hypothetical protein